jgi:hypothetical protein
LSIKDARNWYTQKLFVQALILAGLEVSTCI